MKKHLIACAAALSACVCLADGETEPVTSLDSANSFGWTCDTISAGQFKGYAVQFDNTDTTVTDGIAIKDLVTVTPASGTMKLSASADQIWVWGTTGWTKYFYRDARDGDTGWCKENTSDLTTDKLAKGQTFFFYRGGRATAKIATSGAVIKSETAVEVSVAQGNMAFIAYPWPVTVSLNGEGEGASSFIKYKTGSTALTANSLIATADQIWVWNVTGGNWDMYYQHTSAGWCKSGETVATTDKISYSTGFFFRRGTGSDATLQFDPPTSL